MPRDHGSGLRIYYASDTFGGHVPPQQPRDPLGRADAILRRLKNAICADAHPAQYEGDIKKKQGWVDDIDAALLELAAHYALTKKGKRNAR